MLEFLSRRAKLSGNEEAGAAEGLQVVVVEVLLPSN
jgi:hypothetical protein